MARMGAISRLKLTGVGGGGAANSIRDSKVELQRKLKLSRRPLVHGRIACARDSCHAGKADARIRIVELRGVEGVERLGTELYPAALSEGEALEERQINLFGARSIQNVSAGVAERKLCRGDEGGRIEPALDRALSGLEHA